MVATTLNPDPNSWPEIEAETRLGVFIDEENFDTPVVVVQRIDQDSETSNDLTRHDLDNICRAATLARTELLPLVVVLEGFKMSLLDGMEQLVAWGRLSRELTRNSGIIPLIVVLDGQMVGPVSMTLSLFDLVIATETSSAIVSKPEAIADLTGIEMSADELGGNRALMQESAVVAICAEDVSDGLCAAAEILSFLPASNHDVPPRKRTQDSSGRRLEEVLDGLPASVQGAYDIRNIIVELGDNDDEDGFVELWEPWAKNLVVGFMRIDGHPVGVVANQPQSLAGTIDITASHKGARFVRFCDSLNIPLLTIVDTPGFFPGKDMEWRGMIRHGAQMAFAFIDATVPRLNLTVRKSYGGAYIVMDSRTIGNDLTYAWPTAEIAVMGAKGAVAILHHREDEEARLVHEQEYNAKFMTPYIVAERGLVDDVIDPAESRRVIAAGLAMLSSKREHLPERRHDNMPC